jgi:hypothetical protein
MVKVERAKVFKNMIEEENISVRAFAKKYGFPHSTLESWIVWGRLSTDEYNNLKSQNISDTQILRSITKDRTKTLEFTELDVKIDNLIYELNSLNIKQKISLNTFDKLNYLAKAVETAKFRLEKK